MSSGADGAPLEQKRMTDVTDADRFGVRGQGELITGAKVAVDVSTVPAMVLQKRTSYKSREVGQKS